MQNPSHPKIDPEFSHLVPVADLEEGELKRELDAAPAELAALQTRFGVEELHSVAANLTLIPQADTTVRVDGTIQARLSQICVVSLEPIEETIDEVITVTLLPPDVAEPEGANDGELDGDEDFEPFDGVTIDLGELVSQHIAAAVNPYPRKDGVVFGNQGQLGDNAVEERDNPFAVLQTLKDQSGSTQKH